MAKPTENAAGPPPDRDWNRMPGMPVRAGERRPSLPLIGSRRAEMVAAYTLKTMPTHWRLAITHYAQRGRDRAPERDGKPTPMRYTSARLCLWHPEAAEPPAGTPQDETASSRQKRHMLAKYHGQAAAAENRFERRTQGQAAVDALAAALRDKAAAIRNGTAETESTPIGRIDADGLERLAGAVLWTWHDRRRWAKLRAAPGERRARYLRKTLRSVYGKAGFDPEIEGRSVTSADLEDAALELADVHGVPASICAAYANTVAANGPASVEVRAGLADGGVTFKVGWLEPRLPTPPLEPVHWMKDTRHVRVTITDKTGAVLYDRVLRRDATPREADEKSGAGR